MEQGEEPVPLPPALGSNLPHRKTLSISTRSLSLVLVLMHQRLSAWAAARGAHTAPSEPGLKTEAKALASCTCWQRPWPDAHKQDAMTLQAHQWLAHTYVIEPEQRQHRIARPLRGSFVVESNPRETGSVPWAAPELLECVQIAPGRWCQWTVYVVANRASPVVCWSPGKQPVTRRLGDPRLSVGVFFCRYNGVPECCSGVC